MQTSSKVSYDNWSDWNLGDKIMNIRPVGTYCVCHCHRHHCVDCEFTDSCIKCDHCHHCHSTPPPPPIPPHHHCDCHDPHLFPIDTDGDGFVEGDIIHKVPENYIPNPIPDNIGNNIDNQDDSSEEIQQNYGIPLVDSIPDEIEPVEISNDVNSILNDVDDSNANAEINNNIEESHDDSEKSMNELIETFGTDNDTWSNAKLLDTDSHEIITESPVGDPELKDVEPIIEDEKPVRGRRRVNRGGRRKKED